jgi:hypothetical protein
MATTPKKRRKEKIARECFPVEHLAAEIPLNDGDIYFLNQQCMWRDEKGLIGCTTPIAACSCLIKAVGTTWNFSLLLSNFSRIQLPSPTGVPYMITQS